jgi:hypothetical protein
MATDYVRVRGHILEQAVANVPRSFVEEYAERARRAYAEAYAEVAAHPGTLEHQRIFKLNQDRCFRMDWELYTCAKAHGLIATANLLPENQWYHAYAVSGCFGLTQSYVQAVGDLPTPAKFRERLAEASRCPRLPFDDPEEIFAVKEFYALFAHNPVGRTFTEENQRLGSLMFCVPSKDMRSWAADISVPELLSLYPATKVARKAGRSPTWKPIEKKRETGTE